LESFRAFPRQFEPATAQKSPFSTRFQVPFGL
jgi:hypothetical protein